MLRRTEDQQILIAQLAAEIDAIDSSADAPAREGEDASARVEHPTVVLQYTDDHGILFETLPDWVSEYERRTLEEAQRVGILLPMFVCDYVDNRHGLVSYSPPLNGKAWGTHIKSVYGGWAKLDASDRVTKAIADKDPWDHQSRLATA